MKMCKLSKGAIVQAKDGTIYEITKVNLSTKPYKLEGKPLLDGKTTTLKFKNLKQILKEGDYFESILNNFSSLATLLLPLAVIVAVFGAISTTLESSQASPSLEVQTSYVRGLI